MTVVGAVDCGTNSIRLLVARPGDDGALENLHREMRIVRLGEGVDATGRFTDEAIERTRVALADYVEVMIAEGVDRVRMVATSATRTTSPLRLTTGAWARSGMVCATASVRTVKASPDRWT